MTFDTRWESEVYARSLQINKYPFDHVVSTVMRLYGSSSRSKISVLELGCGTGNNLAFLAREGFKVYGVDGSPTAIDSARRYLDEEDLSAELQCFDFVDLSVYESEKFDFILDRGSITHNSRASILKIISQVKRVLRKGGYFLSVIFSDAHSGVRTGVRRGDGTYSNFRSGYLKGLDFPFYFASKIDLVELYDANFKIMHKIHQVNHDLMAEDDVRAMWSILAQKD